VITKELILQEIQQALSKAKLHRDISIACNVYQWIINLHEELIKVF